MKTLRGARRRRVQIVGALTKGRFDVGRENRLVLLRSYVGHGWKRPRRAVLARRLVDLFEADTRELERAPEGRS